MKNLPGQSKPVGYLLLSLTICFWFFSFYSCTKDFVMEENNVIPDEGHPIVTSSPAFNTFLLRYDKNDGTIFRTDLAGSYFGGMVDSDDNLNGEKDGWDYLAGVQVKGRQFMALHNGNKEFAIRYLDDEGYLGAETDYQNWSGNYETFLGFHVGDKGFIFGQDSYGGHYWFVQEVNRDGTLAANECDNGEWHNYYKTAAPFYVNGKTFLFFQEEGSYLEGTLYWFIASVSSDGRLTDVCDGEWGNFWERVTSVEIAGKAYLIGHRKDGNTGKGEFFIQRIYENGTLGPETDRGWWNNYYKSFTSFVSNGTALLYGGAGNNEYNGLNYFFQQITPDGKMGAETNHGTLDRDYDLVSPFNLHATPGSFRYTIGWDLSKSTGEPARSWSGIFSDPWSGEMKLGGGAALANIDKDASGKYDAVLVGIQSRVGEDRFYYKVAWNLDGTGKASSWSQTLFGPNCGMNQSGGGADIADIDRNGIPDLLIMSVDAPGASNDNPGDIIYPVMLLKSANAVYEANSFRYNIGWNMGKDGKVTSWSSMIQGPSIGNSNSGGGAALGDIDKNGRPDLVLMGVDNPEQGNAFRYSIGKNLDGTGKPASWTPVIQAPCYLGWSNTGGGASLADINGNGKLDLVLSGIDSPSGANNFWCYIGWDIDINGNVTGWSPKFLGSAVGHITEGGGTAVGDIDHNGKMDILLMGLDNPYGAD